MKTLVKSCLAAALALSGAHAANWTAGMKDGRADVKSVSQLAFGPEGILFIADSKSAAVFAIATGDTKAGSAAALKADGINQKVAALLGTAADQIQIADLAVNPVSKQAYLAVSRGSGPGAVPVLVRVKGDGKLETVSLDKVKFSKAELPDAPADAEAGEGKRKSNQRQVAITDIAFLQDRVLIAGMSNEEFKSTLRAIPFPFKTVPNGTSVEIYHGAHGRFETDSPVRTFVPFNVGNTPSLLAAYQCTPLVQLPISDLKPGARVKGKTIAELGNRNRPLDMITYNKGGKDWILIANSSRGLMKIDTAQIEGAGSITEKVADKQGVSYETLESWSGVEQLDRLDDRNALVLRRSAEGAMSLESLPLP
jgi:hypothetical protein